VVDLRRNLAELHAGTRSTAESVAGLLTQITSDPRYKAMVSLSLRFDLDESRSLSPIRTGHLSAIVNEALSNVVRHAQAQNVDISAKTIGKDLKIVISDDGIGFPEDQKTGYGLRNIRDRTRLLNGTIEFINNKGTTISLVIPWMD
jgi:signal transduction histidine kinase